MADDVDEVVAPAGDDGGQVFNVVGLQSTTRGWLAWGWSMGMTIEKGDGMMTAR
jgi:hypothetical protein